ncbi:T6SS phospholipase effector Tle1-like catalytic domain-containing protein [Pseudomonas sp. NPDC088444]|uniref:T6SS phospholipase effector Tle1-like catalytic domain-containing protein n=1 Tax=Pseudomonas sp. NPDC088444 TaxID=3364456 RepID=UPI00384B2D10
MTTLHSVTGSSGVIGALDVTVRIGVFFDGTGNNRINSQIGADCQAMAEVYNGAHIKECGGRHTDPGSSYSNDLTNIARLADLYRDQPVARNDGQGLKVYRSVYVSGIGTKSGGRDSRVSGQGFGRGNTGVVAKVSRCIKKIDDVLKAFEDCNPGCVIGALEFDLFGFSRGAAAARHMANEVLKQSGGALDPLLRKRRSLLAAGFSWASHCVRLKVIGLFDTVAAVGGWSDLGNVRDEMNARVNLFLPPGCAQQVLHLVAGDEHRRNFALNRVAPDWPREVVLPGSHSDIGGGYHPQSVESVSLTRPRRSLVSANTPYDATDAWLQTHAELDSLDAQRWIDPQDENASIGIECFERMAQRGRGMKTVVASVKLERRVFGHLSRVYLRVMHALACDEGVPFRPIPDVADLNVPLELKSIAEKLLAYARGLDVSLTADEMQMLYRRYIHCSAHWNAFIGRSGALVDSPFIHAPAVGGRQRFAHVSQPGYPL